MAPNTTIELPQPYNKIGDGPEKPEVKIMADYLRKNITNSILTGISTNWEKLVNSDNWYQGVSMLPARITSVADRGKFIYWTLASLKNGQNLYMTCTVHMTGKCISKLGKYTKAIFYIQHDLPEPVFVNINNQQYQYQQLTTPLFFDSKRGLSKLIFKFSLAELQEKLKEYGPDLLNDDITSEQYIARIRRIRSEVMTVAKFLLEQRYFAGVGNYLRCEILFRMGIHPLCKLKSLSDEKLAEMLYWSQRLIRESYLAGGVSIIDYESPTGRKGEFKLHVYRQHTVDPNVRYTKINGRGVYWNEAHQFI